MTIIIPAYNERENIARCLSSICSLDTGPYTFQVVVVDNGSSDETLKIAGSFGGRLRLKVLVAPGITVGAMRNLGVKNSNSRFCAFVDADCTVDHDWLRKGVEGFQGESVAAVGCTHHNPEHYSWVATAWDAHLSQRRKSCEADSIPSGNMFVDREKFISVGGFDESLRTNEDYDLCFRLIEAGYRILSDSRVVCVHWGVPRNLCAFYRQCRWHGTHVLKVFKKGRQGKKNGKVLAFGAYHLVSVLLVGSLFLGWLLESVRAWVLLGGVGVLLMPSAMLTCRSIIRVRTFAINDLALLVLYFVYGVARGDALVRVWIGRQDWLVGHRRIGGTEGK